MREAFVEHAFRGPALLVVERANEIIEQYQRRGFTLTLRQLYYQFVARGLVPNQQREYDRLGAIISDARLAGLIDWDAIEDRTRNLRALTTWSSPADVIMAAAEQYREDPWAKQPCVPEVWIEKDALIGVIEPACNRLRVAYFACRGYTSQSEQYRAGRRFARLRAQGKLPIVLHLGDHDPSGIDMTRDNSERLAMFARHGVAVKRLALNSDQIERHRPPPNPVKFTDSRSPAYVAQHGRSSWELDALDPTVIDQLVTRAVEAAITNRDAWDRARRRERRRKKILRAAAARWGEVVEFLGRMKDDDGGKGDIGRPDGG